MSTQAIMESKVQQHVLQVIGAKLNIETFQEVTSPNPNP
jgi:hypothetical protein